MTHQFTSFDVNSTKFLAQCSISPEIPVSAFNRFNVNWKLHRSLGWTLAHVLAVRGYWKPVDTLMNIGMDPDKGDSFGWTARQLSQDIHGVDIFSGETCKPITPLAVSEDFGITPTHILAISGKPLPLFECVQKGDCMNEVDCFGNTALDYVESLHHDGDHYRRLITIHKEMSL